MLGVDAVSQIEDTEQQSMLIRKGDFKDELQKIESVIRRMQLNRNFENNQEKNSKKSLVFKKLRLRRFGRRKIVSNNAEEKREDLTERVEKLHSICNDLSDRLLRTKTDLPFATAAGNLNMESRDDDEMLSVSEQSIEVEIGDRTELLQAIEACKEILSKFPTVRETTECNIEEDNLHPDMRKELSEKVEKLVGEIEMTESAIFEIESMKTFDDEIEEKEREQNDTSFKMSDENLECENLDRLEIETILPLMENNSEKKEVECVVARIETSNSSRSDQVEAIEEQAIKTVSTMDFIPRFEVVGLKKSTNGAQNEDTLPNISRDTIKSKESKEKEELTTERQITSVSTMDFIPRLEVVGFKKSEKPKGSKRHVNTKRWRQSKKEARQAKRESRALRKKYALTRRKVRFLKGWTSSTKKQGTHVKTIEPSDNAIHRDTPDTLIKKPVNELPPPLAAHMKNREARGAIQTNERGHNAIDGTLIDNTSMLSSWTEERHDEIVECVSPVRSIPTLSTFGTQGYDNDDDEHIQLYYDFGEGLGLGFKVRIGVDVGAYGDGDVYVDDYDYEYDHEFNSYEEENDIDEDSYREFVS